jgi:adenylate cyclase
MVVLAADIDRFNLATRHMTVEQFAEFLQGFYEVAGEVLMAHRGRLVKYIGDALLVVFEEGREELAVRTGCALREAYRRYVEDQNSELRVTELSVGISVGDVVAGQVGHPEMLTYDVLGRPVTTAFVLLNCGGVILDRAMAEAVANRVVVEPVQAPGGVSGLRVTALR